MKSLNFDRAADFYDQTRSHPPGVSDQIADSVIGMLPSHARVLEIGIGTGRISRPLIERGLQVVGVDLSVLMMKRLVKSQPTGSPTAQLAQADAANLPLQSGVFDAVLAVHVFHLIAEWRQALKEIRRMLRPGGGLLLSGYDQRLSDSPPARLRDQWRKIVYTHLKEAEQPGARDINEIIAVFNESGAELDEVEVAQWSTNFQIASYIEALENGIYSSSWRVPPDVLPECIAELRQWAVREFGSIDRAFTIQRKFIWQRFRWQ